MNNLKKIGLSALAGSLVAVSANAGELAAVVLLNSHTQTKMDLQVLVIT